MIRRRRSGRVRVWFARDRGFFTAELAAGLPALMLLLLAGLTAVSAVITRGQCVDASREAALMAARGGASGAAAPAGAEVSISIVGDAVTAWVRAPVGLLGANLPAITVAASSTAALEPGAGP